ncbi:MAG: hypothetical protein IPP34_06915 [Bacteroidetes bacterium]|nr:hypothetical protein [Bacteroidota bacterium]
MKNTVIILFYLLTFGFVSIAYSQKCEVTKDPITGDKVITANYKDRWVYMENKGENTKLAIVKGYVGELNISSPVGDEFIIKLDNDEILNLKTSAVAAPNSYISQGVVYTNYTLKLY